ncbi:GDSL-type esterase/lipase family protein [Gaetbulibacter aquiaggeris]|uniref:GDSL-type esterase/lipase family protein n=1 Tax=Gaetbulibacter aquiaggeris TaxID=1735373 RepID=A0ABW7MRZ5_9FLAO
MKLLCIGDSLTFGYETAVSKKWTSLLEIELNIDVINFGINGDTTSGMLSRFMAAIREFKPTHCLIFGGTNDLWFGLNDEFIISNVYAMCKQASYFNVMPLVGIPTPCYNHNELNVIGENYSERIKKFQELLIQFCSTKEIKCINFNEGIDKDFFMEDGMHYNEKGHVFMMNLVREKWHGLF